MESNLRVGRCVYAGGVRKDPSFPGFKNVVVMMKSHSRWGVLGPYELRDDDGKIMENIWQFSKVYETVPKTQQRYSRYDSRIIWEYPAETHVNSDGVIQDSYYKWRQLGMQNKFPVRYPVGYDYRHDCKYALSSDGKKLDYIEARKKIYLPIYIELVKKQPLFKELVEMLVKGEKLLLIEVDGPHQESLEYYMEKYGVAKTFIENGTMMSTRENIEVMLNDPKHPFGHGYCLAAALLEESIKTNVPPQVTSTESPYYTHKNMKCGHSSRKCRYCHIEKEICKEDLVGWTGFKDYGDKYKTITTLLTIEARYRHKLEPKHWKQLDQAFKTKGSRSLKNLIATRIDKKIKTKPDNDGKQTPYMGHAVDMAMHSMAVCCRFCVEHWHGIKNDPEYVLKETETVYLVDLVYTYMTEFLIPVSPFRTWMTSRVGEDGQFYEHGKYVIAKDDNHWIAKKIGTGSNVLTPWYKYVNELKRKHGARVDIKKYLLQD